MYVRTIFIIIYIHIYEVWHQICKTRWKLKDKTNRYRISANSWIWPYVLWPLVTVHKSAETIQVRKLFAEVRYAHLISNRERCLRLCVLLVKSTECSIISGPGQVGTNCTFPFEFGGTIYNGCALDPKTNERWCATSVDKNGKFQPLGYEGQGNYGICLESCPKYDHTGNLFLCFFDLAGIWI